PEERRQLLIDWNDTAHPVPPATVPALFEAQVGRRPDAVALVLEGASLDYGTLNARANRLAHHLIGLGIGPEDIVALSLPRSFEMVVTLLAILKAGAAYLPLDPDYPEARLAVMLADARPRCVIALDRTAWRLGGGLAEGTPILCLDDRALVAALEAAPQTDPSDAERRRPLDPRSPAYVIYTSGSTGTPKGVVVTHAGIPGLLASQIDRFAVTAESRIVQFASLSFDAALWEICMALLSGAALVLVPEDRRSGAGLGAVLARDGVTHATLPPAVLTSLSVADLAGVTHLLVAGEACPPEVIGEWSRGRHMLNGYGPTEVTVCATMSDALQGSIAAPLGKPLYNTRLYVLDEGLRLVPAGVAGEL
ncbi:AMP-binding protein, partial [Nitrospirillum iridis]|uniref:AMP-binding protein n=1 Tax=Nitrospirillum iridis TaxID=765888 RepID=UPI00161561E9